MLQFLLEKYFETNPKLPNDVPLVMAVIQRMYQLLRDLAKRPVGQTSSILWFLQAIPGTVEGVDRAFALGCAWFWRRRDIGHDGYAGTWWVPV